MYYIKEGNFFSQKAIIVCFSWCWISSKAKVKIRFDKLVQEIRKAPAQPLTEKNFIWVSITRLSYLELFTIFECTSILGFFNLARAWKNVELSNFHRKSSSHEEHWCHTGDHIYKKFHPSGLILADHRKKRQARAGPNLLGSDPAKISKRLSSSHKMRSREVTVSLVQSTIILATFRNSSVCELFSCIKYLGLTELSAFFQSGVLLKSRASFKTFLIPTKVKNS